MSVDRGDESNGGTVLSIDWIFHSSANLENSKPIFLSLVKLRLLNRDAFDLASLKAVYVYQIT